MRTLKKELWPHKITIDFPAADSEREQWLGEQLGAFKVNWNIVYFHNKTDFYFRNEQDALLFALRWA